MTIITISGKAGHGKDYTAKQIKKILESGDNNNKVLITHYADLLKFICKNMFDWNGRKDETGRHLLQYVGTDVVRKQQPDFWVDYMISVLSLFSNEWDYVVIPDARFPNEIDKLKKSGFDVIPVYVTRPDYDNGLTEAAKSHPSENALNDYKFNYMLNNIGGEEYINNIYTMLFDIVTRNIKKINAKEQQLKHHNAQTVICTTEDWYQNALNQCNKLLNKTVFFIDNSWTVQSSTVCGFVINGAKAYIVVKNNSNNLLYKLTYGDELFIRLDDNIFTDKNKAELHLKELLSMKKSELKNYIKERTKECNPYKYNNGNNEENK